MEQVRHLTTCADPLLTCCLCKGLLQDAVQLTCLHNSCRRCFSNAVSQGSHRNVTCTICGAFTHAGTEQPNSFIDKEVQRFAAIAESRFCGLCKRNGELDKPALVWCPDCRHSLCGECIAPHRHYYRQHITQSLEDLKGLDEVSSQPSAVSTCPAHAKPQEIACSNCEQAKCISCWKDCKAKNHEMYIVGEASFDRFVAEFIARISSTESELLRKSEDLDKSKSFVEATRMARVSHLELINQRKRRIVDAVEAAYQEIECLTKNVYDDLEKEAITVSAAADVIASNILDAKSYIHLLVESKNQCEILNQQKIVRERLRVLSAELHAISDKLVTAMRAVKFDSSMPDNLENVVKAWIGNLRLYSVRPQQHVSFGSAFASCQLPLDSRDVALTKDGRLLLAANELGLIEFSSEIGRELSRWVPPKQSSLSSDSVLAVAALNDGRAAVGLLKAKLVVLLRRSEKIGGSRGKTVDQTWTKCFHIDIAWEPWLLSAHGDMLAVATGSRRLQLVSIGSRRWLGKELQRPYRIGSLTVAAQVVVTGSCCKMKLNGGRWAYVLEAHSLADGADRLWRHELSSNDDEELWGCCADSTGGCLYAAVWRRDALSLSRARVSALSLVDGSVLRRVALCFDSPAPQQHLLLPVRLSLSESIAAEQYSSNSRILLLAALCWDRTTCEWSTVTVHRSNVATGEL